MATFTISPSYAPILRRKVRVLAAKFGDGYEQRGADGLHPDLRIWELTFQHLILADADAVEAFFSTNDAAVTPFDWTPPRGAAGKFLCRSWSRRRDGVEVDTITATFEEVADP